MRRTRWPRGSHERAVEDFYARGVQGQTEIHRGYLNFGLWSEGIVDYVEAAESLVSRLGLEAGLSPGCRLLDVGCGHGSQDLFLQRRFGPLDIDALDVTWSHVKGARRRAAAEGLADRIRFHHGSATQLPFPGASFTHILGIEAPVHFLTRRRFFDEAMRVLVPGGVMVLADYALSRRPRSLVERTVFGAARALWRVPPENVCGADEYRDQLAAAGFCGVSIESIGHLTFPGYYREQRRPEFRREMARLQGRLRSRVGTLVNVAAHRTYSMGIVDYLLVCAEKPRPENGGGAPSRARGRIQRTSDSGH